MSAIPPIPSVPSLSLDDAVPEPTYLGLFDFYAHMGLVRIMEPDTEELMRELAERERAEDDYDSPHSRAWYLSFHGSAFPGDEQDACKRKLLYTMMNFPRAEATPPWVSTTGDVGKAGELAIARAWWEGGRMLAIPEDPEMRIARLKRALELARRGIIDNDEVDDIHQLGFVRPDLWFTVSTDLPILKHGWRRPHITEVKGKADEVVEEMLQGRLIQKPDGTLERVGRGPDYKHTLQLRATVGEAHDYDWGWVTVCPHCWFIVWSELYERLGIKGGRHPRSDAMGYCPRCRSYAGDENPRDYHFQIEPPTSGSIYYWSRSWPRKTKEFYFEHDHAFMETGRQVLREAREHFLRDEIPPRPAHFQWSVGPCATCDFKASACRLDAGLPPRARKPRPDMIVTKLSESNGVAHAQTLRPNYDPERIRERVLSEWGEASAVERDEQMS